MRKLMIAGLMAAVLVGCAGEAENKREKLHNEVMAIHDEVMPRMSEVGLLLEETETCLTAYRSVEADSITGPKIQALKESYGALKEADNGMFNWMQNYSKPGSDVSDEEAIKYLEGQKAVITDVASAINASLEAGKPLTENCEPGNE